jgi:hypothetical protein
MRRFVMALTSLIRRWRYVEEEGADAPRTAASAETEAQRLRRSIARDEALVADFRRQGCAELARAREASLRALRTRLSAIES